MGFGLGSFLGSLIGVGSSIYGAQQTVKAQKLANETNLQINRENNQANRELAEYAYSQNLEQWERENAYNTPAAQQSRLIEAGLNPNLLNYGSNSGMVSASSPEYKAPTMNAIQIANEKAQLGMYMAQIGALASQATLNSAKADKVKAETENTEAKTFAQITQNEFLRANEERKREIIYWNLNETISRANMMSAKSRMVNNEATLSDAKLFAIDEYYQSTETALVDYYKDVIYDERNILSFTRQEKENLVKVAEERANYLAQATVNLLKDAVLKDDVHKMNEFEIRLNDMGFTKSDDVYWRILYTASEWISKFGNNVPINNNGQPWAGSPTAPTP